MDGIWDKFGNKSLEKFCSRKFWQLKSLDTNLQDKNKKKKVAEIKFQNMKISKKKVLEKLRKRGEIA